MTSHSPTESDIRSAVSRAYYAVYHHVLAWWKSQNRFPDFRDRGHAKMQMALSNAGIPDAKKFSRYMLELNIARRKADYELALSFDLATGQSTLDLARRAVAAFDALDKTALANGVEDYLRKTNQI